MKARIVQRPLPCLTIDEKNYPLNLSVYATEVLGEKYGSLEKMSDALSEMPDYKQFSELLEIFHLMMEQGALRESKSFWDRLFFRVPTLKKMKVKFGMPDINMLYEKLTESVTAGSQTTVEVAEKNAKPMQGATG